MIKRALRPLLFLLGLAFTVIGAVGVVLPLLPTTPFMLLALWCFARSSQRFHDWIYSHKIFGPPLQAWEQDGVITVKTKILAVSMIIASYIYMLTATNIPPIGAIVAGIILTAVAVFLLTRPSVARNTDDQ